MFTSTPLRKFLGLVLAAATPLESNIHHIIGDTHLHTERLHVKYGEIIRIALDQLSFIINEEAWKDISMYRQDANGKAVKQMHKATRRPDQNGVYSILNASDDVHARQRKMLSHAFSPFLCLLCGKGGYGYVVC
jgi:hypothetical protein